MRQHGRHAGATSLGSESYTKRHQLQSPAPDHLRVLRLARKIHHMVYPWELLSSTDAFHNRWLHVTLDAVRLPNGRFYEYTTIRRDSVGVAAVVLNEHNQLLLEQEYRHPVGEVTYQLPGGLNAVGEDPAECIRRELREETGVLAEELHYLGRFWNNPATSNGECLIYLCRDFRHVGVTEHDAAEFLAWDWHDLDWVKARIVDGIIRDRVVVCGLAYLWLFGVTA